MVKMKVVMSKQNGELALIAPYWEIPETDEIADLERKEAVTAGLGDSHLKVGFLVQMGWLLQNQNDLSFVLPMKAIEHFEVLGPL